MGQDFNADDAREALQEAKRMHTEHPDSPETTDAWLHAAELFEVGAATAAYAASQTVFCYRRAGKWDEALRIGREAVNTFSEDDWVRRNTALAEYDRSKASDNTDEVLDALRNIIGLMKPLADQGVLADCVYYRLRRLLPNERSQAAPETPIPSVVDFATENFEMLFNGCTIQPSESRDGEARPPIKEALCWLVRHALILSERWDDLSYTMSFAVQTFPNIREFAVSQVMGLMEMGHHAEALDAATDALRERPNAELVRLKARAMAALDRHAEAEAELLAACYRFRDVMLWRDLAGIRWTLGNIAGSNRALAVALRLVGHEPKWLQNSLEWRFHQGRAFGALRLDDGKTAALEAVAARRTAKFAGDEADETQIDRLFDMLSSGHSQALDHAESLGTPELNALLGEIYAGEREREINAALRPAHIVWINAGKGFGYLVFDATGKDNSDTKRHQPAVPAWGHNDSATGDDDDGNADADHAERIFFTYKSFEGDAAQIREGLPVRALAPLPPGGSPRPGHKVEAIRVRPLTLDASNDDDADEDADADDAGE